MAPVESTSSTRLSTWINTSLIGLGDWTLFSLVTLAGSFSFRARGRHFLAIANEIGVQSVPVVMITGTFIGMVLAVQAYGQFHMLGLDSWLGSIINMSVIRELGPVLTATMLAGRVGSAMAAELATMRVTEQIDAIACLGVNPIHHLVTPRFLACVLLIPLLTIIADVMGLLGGSLVCVQIYHIDSHHYWKHSRDYVGLWDVFTSLLKATAFGGVMSLIACHRGFHSRAGAAGVGRAATEAFVLSFIAILVMDFFIGLFLNTLYYRIWPDPTGFNKT